LGGDFVDAQIAEMEQLTGFLDAEVVDLNLLEKNDVDKCAA